MAFWIYRWRSRPEIKNCLAQICYIHWKGKRWPRMFYCYRSFWVKGKRNNYLFITLIQYNLYSLSDARLFSLLLHVAKQKKKAISSLHSKLAVHWVETACLRVGHSRMKTSSKQPWKELVGGWSPSGFQTRFVFDSWVRHGTTSLCSTLGVIRRSREVRVSVPYVPNAHGHMAHNK